MTIIIKKIVRQPYQKQVMQGMQNKSWKPFEPCKTCLKGDLGGPGKTK